MKPESERAAESVAKIRQLLAGWLKSNAESREPVADILQLLEPLDAYIRGNLSQPSSARRPAGAGTTYKIEKRKNDEEMLTERREGGSQPYKCPRYIYDATVTVLAKTSPMEFEAVMKGVGKVLHEPPEWQVRTVLRFLLNAQPPLIVRERNKYRPLQPGKLGIEAKQLWQSVVKESK
jgi:hypothetical protein